MPVYLFLKPPWWPKKNCLLTGSLINISEHRSPCDRGQSKHTTALGFSMLSHYVIICLQDSPNRRDLQVIYSVTRDYRYSLEETPIQKLRVTTSPRSLALCYIKSRDFEHFSTCMAMAAFSQRLSQPEIPFICRAKNHIWSFIFGIEQSLGSGTLSPPLSSPSEFTLDTGPAFEEVRA